MTFTAYLTKYTIDLVTHYKLEKSDYDTLHQLAIRFLNITVPILPK